MTFLVVDAPKRTDVSFDEMEDLEHHKRHSSLSGMEIGMVSQFILDYAFDMQRSCQASHWAAVKWSSKCAMQAGYKLYCSQFRQT